MLKNFIIPSYLREQYRWRRALKGCQGFNKNDLDRCFLAICNQIDIERIIKLKKSMEPINAIDPESAAKYPDYNFWLRLNIIRAVQLGLHKTPPKKVLDLGCGPGYFLAVCRYFGHDVVGIDAPCEFLTEVERKVYSEMIEAMKCLKKEKMINAFVPLDLQATFDFITGFLVCFNNHKRENEWSKAQWEFFIIDSLGHLNHKGILWLELNCNIIKYPDLLYYDHNTLKLFNLFGNVNQNIVAIISHNK